jgi:hypothetical protein
MAMARTEMRSGEHTCSYGTRFKVSEEQHLILGVYFYISLEKVHERPASVEFESQTLRGARSETLGITNGTYRR